MRLVDVERETDADGTYRLFAIGDLHLDHITFNEERFLKYRQWIIGDPYSVAIFVGDCAEGRVPGQKHFDPDVLRPKFLRRLNDYYNVVARESAQLLKPLVDAGVPLIVVRGNHDRYSEWFNISRNVAKLAGAKYLGDGGFIRVTSGTTREGVGGKKRRPAQYVTSIYATHGSGGGKTPGPKTNNMEMGSRWLNTQIIVKGHVHDADVRIIPRASVALAGKLEVVQEPLALYRAPAFVEHLSPIEHDSYVIRHEYPTTDRGLLYLNVKPSTGDIWRRECEF